MALWYNWIVKQLWNNISFVKFCNSMLFEKALTIVYVSISGKAGWLQGTAEMGCTGRKGNRNNSTSINPSAIAMSVGLDFTTE